MKTKIYYFILILPFFIFNCSGKEDDQPQITPTTPVIAEFGFDIPAEVSAWNLEEGDSTEIIFDDNIKYSGAGSLKIQKGCARIEYSEGIPIEKGANYKATLQVKNTKTQLCAYAYSLAFIIIQENEMEFYSIYNETEDWHQEIIYFSLQESSSPIQLKILCGLENVWIDQLVIEEI